MNWQQMNDDELKSAVVDAIKELAADGQAPNQDDWRDKRPQNLPSTYVLRQYGGWRYFLTAAGLRPRTGKKVSVAELIAEMLTLADGDIAPTQRRWDGKRRKSLPSSNYITKYIIPWKELVMRAGLRTDYTRKSEEIRRFPDVKFGDAVFVPYTTEWADPLPPRSSMPQQCDCGDEADWIVYFHTLTPVSRYSYSSEVHEILNATSLCDACKGEW